jgi:RHS repeat-associated protein
MKKSLVRSAALALPTLLVLVAHATPNPIDAPDVADPKIQSRPSEGGAYSINSRTGSAAYSYAFKLPPARGGNPPSLALSYSSSGGVRGDVAQGWSLTTIPVIRRDVLRESTPDLRQYTVDLGNGVQELVRVTEGFTPAANVLTFRAKLDRDFVRFEKVQLDQGSYWLARTTDGHVYRFDIGIGEEWFLSNVQDAWGNGINYSYAPVSLQGFPRTVDYVVSKIEYSTNAGGPHSQVLFQWDDIGPCAAPASGLALPVGAQLDYHTGSVHVRGAKRLSRVTAQVKDSASAGYRTFRQWTLNYDQGVERCSLTVSPRRRLLSIQESGNSVSGEVTPGPTVTFGYAEDPRPIPASTDGPAIRTQNLPVLQTDFYSSGHFETSSYQSTPGSYQSNGLSISGGSGLMAPVYSMLVDMDGDGLPDLLRSNGGSGSCINRPGGCQGSGAQRPAAGACQASWYKNRGGVFDGTPTGTFALPLPPPPAAGAAMPPDEIYPVGGAGVPAGAATPHFEAECSLAGTWWALYRHGGTNCIQLQNHGKMVFRWQDFDGDGRTDLLAMYYTDHRLSGNPNCTLSQAGGYQGGQDPTYLDGGSQVRDWGRVYCCDSPYYSYAETCGTGGYKWRYYRNVNGALQNASAPTTQWCLPVSMEGDGPNNNVPEAPSHVLFDIVDVNGDRLPDIVTAAQTNEHLEWIVNPRTNISEQTWCGPTSGTDGGPAQLNVFLGNGSTTSPTPLTSVVSNYHWPDRCILNPAFTDTPNLPAQMMDLNGDGLADLLVNPSAGGSFAILNSGLGATGFIFDPATITIAPNGFASNLKHTVRDIDLDGIPDLVCTDAACSGQLGIGIGFGSGGSFSPPSSLADPNGLRTIKDVQNPDLNFSFQTLLRRSVADYLDLDGDGVAERHRLLAASDGYHDSGLRSDFWQPQPGDAPGLLKTVDNGLGATIQFTYARSTDLQVVVQNSVRPAYAANWNDWIAPSLPFPVWVIKQVVVTPGAGAAAQTTSYKYYDPVFLSDDLDAGTAANRRFRGFQAVETMLPALSSSEQPPKTFERFTYQTDPDGLLDYKALYEFVYQVAPIAREYYSKRTVDSTAYVPSSVLGTVRFIHPQSTTHIECIDDPDPTRCDAQTRFRTTTAYAYTAFGADGQLAPDAAHTVLYGNESTTEDTTTFDGQTLLERKHEADHLVVYGPADHQVVIKKKIEWAGSAPFANQTPGSVATTIVAREDHFFDNSPSLDSPGSAFGGFKGALTRTRVYRDLTVGQINGDQPCRLAPRNDMTGAPSEPVCVDHGIVYDGATGNKLRDVKPAAMAAAGGNPTAATAYAQYTYGDFNLLPRSITNELGHTIQRSYDFGSGQVLAEIGPQSKFGRVCDVTGICRPTRAFATRSFQYDGLGRLRTETDSKDDAAQLYVQSTVRMLDYPNFTTVNERNALSWDFAQQTLTQKQYDGLGRVLRTTVAIDGQNLAAANNEIHTYAYDTRGNLATVIDPDPSNDAGTVSHTFEHDARGRLTSVVAPDGAQVTTTYAPWEKTVRDADGGANHQLVDGFGELRLVDESGTASADVAHTSYDYDGAGRLARVHDADGHDTVLAHDGEGHRRLINRLAANGADASRHWVYSYDVDGNLAHKEDPDHRQTQYGYDPLGRVLAEDMIDPRLPSGTSTTELGIGRTVYTYDQAVNGVGKLSNVAQYDHINVASTDVPYAAVDYSYDSIGDRANESWTLNLSATGTRQLAVSRTFGPQGNLTNETYPTGQSAVWTPNGRGKVQSATAAGQPVATYGYNVAGLPKTRQASGQTRTYGYNVRGRLVTDALAIGGTSLGRTYSYSLDGDVQSIRVQDALGDRPALDTTMTFRYDALHRLTEARGGSGLSYQAGFSYSPAGSILTATVLGAGSEPDRSAALGGQPVILASGVSVKPVSVSSLSLAAAPSAGVVIFPPPSPPPPPPPIPPGITYQYGDGVSADTQAVTSLWAGTSQLAQFIYDAAGNMTDRITPRWSAMSTHYVYDTNDHVRKVTNSVGRSERYYYVDHERYLAVSDDGSWRFYLGGEYELDVTPGASGKEEHSVYVAAGEPVARLTTCAGACQTVAPPMTLVYHDRRGDLLAGVSTNGVVQSHFIYGAFGEVLYQYQANDPSASDWRRRFNGKEWDAISGLSYYGYRFYDPLTLQWSSGDPLNRFVPDINLDSPQHQNLYAFTANNALRLRDPDGRDPAGLNSKNQPPNTQSGQGGASGQAGGGAGQGGGTKTFVLPQDPSQLDPAEWTRDFTHQAPNGERYRDQNGNYLDFDKGQAGKKGWRGRDHWHVNKDEKGADGRHYKPGSQVTLKARDQLSEKELVQLIKDIWKPIDLSAPKLPESSGVQNEPQPIKPIITDELGHPVVPLPGMNVGPWIPEFLPVLGGGLVLSPAL